MLNPEKRILDELEDFILEELEDAGSMRVVYEDILDKIGELKYDVSREYNLVVA